MRASVKGTLKVGPITCPVGLYKGADEKKVGLRQIHAKCLAPIRQQKICVDCGQEVVKPEKGYEVEKDKFVEMDEVEVANLKVESDKILNIKYFTKLSDMSPFAFQGKLQNLATESGFEEVYGMFVAILAEKGLAGIGTLSQRGKEHHIVVIAHSGRLIMDYLFAHDEVRGLPEILTQVPDKATLKLGTQLVSGMVKKFNHKEIKNTYEEELLELAKKTAAGIKTKPRKPGEKVPKKKSALMEQLKQAITEKKATEYEINYTEKKASA